MTQRRVLRSLALLAAGALVATGCASKAPEDAPTPTPSVTVPTGTSLTKPGSTLTFGTAATVPFVPNAQRRTVLTITVSGVQQGTMKDFAAYQLDPTAKSSTPYYVKYSVTNNGPGDVGKLGVPLYAVTGTHQLLQSSSFTNTFATCPSTPLPDSFGPQATASGCLVFLTPAGSQLDGIVFRQVTSQAPITWHGTVTPVPIPSIKPKKKAHH